MKVFDIFTGLEIKFEPLLSIQQFYDLCHEDQKRYLDKNCQRHSWYNLKEMVLIYYGEQCFNCGSYSIPTVDHILPKCEYPAYEFLFSNLQILCRRCNSYKGKRSNESLKKPKKTRSRLVSFAEMIDMKTFPAIKQGKRVPYLDKECNKSFQSQVGTSD